MSRYTRILLAVDLTDECEHVAERAVQLAQECNCELHVIHVLEPMSIAYGGDVPTDLAAIQGCVQDQAASQLQEFAHSIGVPSERQHLACGRTESEIRRVACEADADVIVVGSHGRHGLSLLLGSTANGVLNGARCDVLAVRVGSPAS